MYSCSLCASGFLYKMLFKTVASILLLNLDKKVTFLWYFRCCSKKCFFFWYYRTIWYTSQKEEHYYIVLVTRLLPSTHCGDSNVSVRLQLFRERLSEKVHATIPKGIVGGFEFTVFQRSLKEWHERRRKYVCGC